LPKTGLKKINNEEKQLFFTLYLGIAVHVSDFAQTQTEKQRTENIL